jgi:(E)-4-hydroxy-3-methylbut-2-enyl-diphosphate synthase
MVCYKKTRQITLGNVQIGGNAPISVQTMTKTDTRDIVATLEQIKEVSAAGCDIVRLAVPDMEAAKALKEIVKQSPIPVVADIHFDFKLALKSIENNVAGLRINPGNIGSIERIKTVTEASKDKNIPIRIGINSGSLEKPILEKFGNTEKAMVESAKKHIGYLEKFSYYNIKVSLKSSDVKKTIKACRLFAQEFDYPQHIGVTEAGTLNLGVIKSAIGIGTLLTDGIGNTLRVSLTGNPVDEVIAGRNILKALNLLPSSPKFISCPTCGRIDFDIKKFATEIEKKVEQLNSSITVAVMGCAVNGPGEAQAADVALCGGKGYGAIYKKGKLIKKVKIENVVDEFMAVVYQFNKEEKIK